MKRCHRSDSPARTKLGPVGPQLSWSAQSSVCDLVLERDTDLTRSFFVNRRTIPLPPEPLRRLTIGGIVSFMRWEDRRYDVLQP